jgi:hypothetical protein
MVENRKEVDAPKAAASRENLLHEPDGLFAPIGNRASDGKMDLGK